MSELGDEITARFWQVIDASYSYDEQNQMGLVIPPSPEGESHNTEEEFHGTEGEDEAEDGAGEDDGFSRA